MHKTGKLQMVSGDRTAGKKKERPLRFLTHNAILSKHGIFSSISDSLTINCVMLLFQVISFLTTWAGSSFLLSSFTQMDVLPAALEKAEGLPPLFCALGVQMILFVFSSRLRRRLSLLMGIVMLLAWGVSTYTSYIGIYKVVQAPTVMMETRYDRADAEFSEWVERTGYEAGVALTQELTRVSRAVEKVFSDAEQIKADAEQAYVDAAKLDNVSSSLKKPEAGRGDDVAGDIIEYMNNLSHINNEALELCARERGFADAADMKEKKAQAEAVMEQVASTIRALSCVAEETELTSAAEVSAALLQMRSAWTVGTQTLESEWFYRDYYALIALTGETDRTFDFSQLRSALAMNEEAAANGGRVLPAYDLILKEVLQKDGDISDENLFQAVTVLNQEILSAAEKLGMDEAGQELQIPNLFVMPGLAVVQGEQNAVPCLVAAAFFDLVTVLLGLVGTRKKRNPLSKKYVSDAEKESVDILEETIIAAAKTQVGEDLSSPMEYAEKTMALLSDFFRCFRNKVAYAGDETYVFFAEYDGLAVGRYDLVLNVLFRFNYAKLVPENVFLKLTTPLNQPVEDKVSDKQYILLRSNVAFWFSKLYSELVSAGYFIRHTDELTGAAKGDVFQAG